MLKVNEYFDGKVKSIALQTATLPATVGVMEPGEYEFGTSQKEVMTIISGAMDVLLPGDTEWKTIAQGESFEIAANVKFGVRMAGQTAYFCTYE
ncbi:pyrimidine/purine nucleoside phosphorylase [Thalassolituus sp. LLYu03]|uniref:pyrimidine/purine nucleoside phosphorylase n=1 Tax=Thalassolituus sp. LLYu03 TaxID=3421656 RepID=UPI003D2A4B28